MTVHNVLRRDYLLLGITVQSVKACVYLFHIVVHNVYYIVIRCSLASLPAESESYIRVLQVADKA